MAHKHSVYDTDLHFIIDPITRVISSESGKVTLMQNDHNSERFTFEIPRYVEGHDMSLCNVVQIHYVNTNSSNKREKSEDIYDVKDLQVSPDSDDVVIGSWLISQNSTKYGGTLHFTMRFACVVDTVLEYQWFTDIYKVINIAPGIYNVDVATNDDDTDLLESWKEEILANTLPYVTEIAKEAHNTLVEVNKKIGDTEFLVNFDTGELEYVSPNYTFEVNTETGNLEWSGSNEPVDAVKYPIRHLSKEKSNAITKTVDGEVIFIDDSSNDPIRELRVFGRTEQKTTTGKNLFNPENVLNGYFREDISIAMSSNTRMVYASCLPDTTYTISKTAGSRFFVGYTTKIPEKDTTVNGVINNSEASAITITTGSDAVYLAAFVYITTADTITVEEMLASVQIELGDTATDWEPYTGGIPSPNPDYPQELESIECPTVTITGKNLIQNNRGDYTNSGLTYTANSDGSITINGTSTAISYYTFDFNNDIPCRGKDLILSYEGNNGQTSITLGYFKEDGSVVNSIVYSDGAEATFQYPEEAFQTRTFLAISEGKTFNNLTVYPMVRVAGSESRYEEPKAIEKLAINHTLPAIPVNDESLATYTDSDGQMWCSDEIDFEKGLYIQRLANRRLLATDKWSSMSSEGRYWLFGTEFNNISSNAFCTHFTRSNDWADHILTDNTFIVHKDPSWSDGRLSFKTKFLSLTDWQSFLNSNDVRVIYELNKPIYTPLDDNVIESYMDLFTNHPNTTVMSDSNVKMELTYNVDLKSYINKHGGGGDWSVNDQNETGYIANRTHWVEGGLVELVPECSYTATIDQDCLAIIDENTDVVIESGKTYIVKFNGEEYVTDDIIDESDDIGYKYICLGNPLVMGGADNGLPFSIFYVEMPESDGGNHILAVAPISILETQTDTEFTFGLLENGEIVHQIDPKFIPDSASAGPVINITVNSVIIEGDYTAVSDTSYEVACAMTDSQLQAAVNFKYPHVSTTDHASVISISRLEQSDGVSYIRFLVTIYNDSGLNYNCLVEEWFWYGGTTLLGSREYSLIPSPLNSDHEENMLLMLGSDDGNNISDMCWRFPKSIVMRASDDDSKKFKITVNSAGTITATEIT